MAEWRKAIPEARDRLQSRLLVWVVMLVLTGPAVLCILLASHPYNSGLLALEALGVSLTFGVLVWALRAATPFAALCGSTICLLVITGSGHTNQTPIHSGLAPLGALFVLTFASTKAGRKRKAKLGVAEGARGRNAAQIVANLGMTALVVVGCRFDVFGHGSRGVGFSAFVMPALLLAALCEATADTVSSEIGQAFGGQPILLTTLRPVDPGTDGAVSALGTTTGILAAAIVAASGMWAMHTTLRLALAGLIGGLAGLLFDSLLGATIERRGYFGNDLVNFASTAFAATVALAVATLAT